LGHVQLKINEPIAFRARIANHDAGLTVFVLTDRTAILTGNPTGHFPLLREIATVTGDHAEWFGKQLTDPSDTPQACHDQPKDFWT
jgi:hypothetical protein